MTPATTERSVVEVLRAARETAYVGRVSTLAENLRPGEALAIPGVNVWIARTKAGRLRIGGGWVSVRWWRGDWRALLADHIAALTDPRRAGHFAYRNRRELEIWLKRPTATRLLSRVGSTEVRCQRSERRLKLPSAEANA